MPTRRPLRPIKEEGRQFDWDGYNKRKQYEGREMAVYYLLWMAAYPFIRAYVGMKSFFLKE